MIAPGYYNYYAILGGKSTADMTYTVSAAVSLEWTSENKWPRDTNTDGAHSSCHSVRKMVLNQPLLTTLTVNREEYYSYKSTAEFAFFIF